MPIDVDFALRLWFTGTNARDRSKTAVKWYRVRITRERAVPLHAGDSIEEWYRVRITGEEQSGETRWILF